jgi:sulfur transfer protein SufE/stress-induced morphogen
LAFSPRLSNPFVVRTTRISLQADRQGQSTVETSSDDLGLTPELRKLTNAFESIGDDKLRYKQLLYMANQLPPMDESLKLPENQVPGCLSTVHVHATLDKNGKVHFVGDSDGLLTKGLVSLLIRGLNGNTPADIQPVDPKFIEVAGISASLTPGRNNGFLNMLAVMKKKALELTESASAAPSDETTSDQSSSGGSKYDAIVEALQKLQPVKLELVDNSHKHAGHTGAPEGGESHFDLYIVSDAFEGLNLVKRHKLVYMMLGEIMPTIHALQIQAKTPAEVGI